MIRHSEGKVVLTPEQIEAQKANLDKMRTTMQEFLEVRKNWKESGKSLDDLIKHTTKMMEISDDCPTVFNFRKELIEMKLMQILSQMKELSSMASKTDMTEEEKEENKKAMKDMKEKIVGELKTLAKEEITFLTKLIMYSPKSYELWFHRLWLLQKISEIEQKYLKSNENSQTLMTKDLMLCAKFLEKDNRNFHVWNYRIEVINKLLSISSEQEKIGLVDDELKFIKAKMEEGFSNYSAFHFFTKFTQLKADLTSKSIIAREDVMEVFKNNLESLFISPNEQALWIFNKWCIDNVTDLCVNFGEIKDKCLLLYTNKNIDIAVARSLDIDVDGKKIVLTDEDILQNCIKLKIDNLPAMYTIRNRRVCEIRVKENSVVIEEKNNNENLKEELEQAIEYFENADIGSIETQLFKPLNLFYVKKAVSLNTQFNTKEDYINKLKECLEYLVKESKTNDLCFKNCYFKKLIERTEKCINQGNADQIIKLANEA